MCWRPLSTGQAPTIVTFNVRHFRREHLEGWSVRVLHPQSFLIEIFRPEESVVLAKLEQQAGDRGRTVPQLLEILRSTVPGLVPIVSAALSRQQRVHSAPPQSSASES